MTPFRPEPKPEDIQDPELKMLGQWCQFKQEQKQQSYLDELRAPLRAAEQRKAEAERQRLAPFDAAKRALAHKVFR